MTGAHFGRPSSSTPQSGRVASTARGVGETQMRHRWRCIAALATGLAGWTMAAAAQDCPVSVAQPPPGWGSFPPSTLNHRVLKPVLGFKCAECVPAVVAIIDGGRVTLPATPNGLAWAHEATTLPVARDTLLGGIVNAMRASAPACTVNGEVEGVTTLNPLGLAMFSVRKKCPQQETEVTSLDFMGFDGRCLFTASVSWLGTLSPQSRGRIHDLVQSLAFGRPQARP